jgi:hypothetical protein
MRAGRRSRPHTSHLMSTTPGFNFDDRAARRIREDSAQRGATRRSTTRSEFVAKLEQLADEVGWRYDPAAGRFYRPPERRH